jgi:hypothetical protein
MQLLSLYEALKRLARRSRKSVLSSSVWQPLRSALRSGTLASIGDIEKLNGTVTERRVRIPTELWETVAETDFVEAALSEKVIYIPRCFVPHFDGAFLSSDSKDALWDRFFMGARPSSLPRS